MQSPRLQLWRALAELFLDTELDAQSFDFIARTVAHSGYGLAEVERILWAEVYPVLKANLESPAGEWAGWSDEWLLQHLHINASTFRPRATRIAREIERCWRQVRERVTYVG